MILHHIDSPPALAAHCIEGLQAHLTEARLGFRAQATGTDVLGIIGQILGFVVVETVRSTQANGWQGLAIQNRHCKFGASDPLFNQRHIVVLTGREPGLLQISQ